MAIPSFRGYNFRNYQIITRLCSLCNYAGVEQGRYYIWAKSASSGIDDRKAYLHHGTLPENKIR